MKNNTFKAISYLFEPYLTDSFLLFSTTLPFPNLKINFAIAEIIKMIF